MSTQQPGEPPDAETPHEKSDRRSCFWFRGDEGASAGRYRPVSYELRFRGDDIAQHHVMHLHEIHHKVLNDDTAWGAMIHVAARHPGWDAELLDTLLDRCRLVHEAFASYMAVSLASQRHDDAELVLEAYPAYRPMVRRMNRLLSPVPPGHRRDLAATAIARFCMSTPILDLALAAYPSPLAFSDIPSSWTPDQRFLRVSLIRPPSIAAAAAEADARFAAVHGTELDELALEETDELLDGAWSDWETAFLSRLVESEPRLESLPRVLPDAHLEAAAALARAAAAIGYEIPLPHEAGAGPISDAESVQRIFTATEVQLRNTPWPAALAEVGADVVAADVLALAGAGPSPALVIHGRRAEHLRSTFSLGAGDLTALGASAEPVFAVRLLIEEGGADLILNATLPTPESYEQIVGSWPAGQVSANCITASCYLDADWQQAWGPALRAAPTVVLVDTGLLGMMGDGRLLGASGAVHAAYVGLHSPSLKALVCHVDGHPHVLLVLADDLTVQLFAGQLEDLLGDRLRMRDADWSEWLPTLAAVCGSVVGTERSLRFDGLGRS